MRKLVKVGLLPVIALVLAFASTGVASAATPTPFFNGFETDTSGWFGDITRVASGTDGVPSATGSFHAEAGPVDDGPFTRWNGYTNEFPAGGYQTAVDMYLDPTGLAANSTANDRRFDWSSAVSDTSATPQFRRDFVFNAGYYSDTDITGSGPRFVISASNNAGRGSSFPKNPGRDPFTITATGWYTFQHVFRDNGLGVLAVDLRILDANGNVLHTWTLSDPTDVIGVTVGGNRYGAFFQEEFPFLAIDNSRLDVKVGPPTDKDQCKKDGWKQFNNPAFKNQGDCVSFVATHGKNPGNG
jgi:hypothetical protein